MGASILWLLILLLPGNLTERQYNCKDDRRYLALSICIVENVDIDEITEQDVVRFPDAVHLEFRNANFRYFGVELFQLLGDTQRVTFRNGAVREILFWSSTVKMLRVINTDLRVFDVLGEPNYSLKELTIRSAQYSNWYPDMNQLKALEVIDIGYCNFSYLNLDWFGGFDKLRVLDVSFNRLHSLHSGPFLVLNSLQELFLAGNRLEYVWRFPDAFPKLKLITLSSNRWLCDWVTIARDAIWITRIITMDSDFKCANGWSNNGGLCCRRSGSSDVERRVCENIEEKPPKVEKDLVLTVKYIIEMDDRNNTQQIAVGAETDDAVVFVDQPLHD